LNTTPSAAHELPRRDRRICLRWRSTRTRSWRRSSVSTTLRANEQGRHPPSGEVNRLDPRRRRAGSSFRLGCRSLASRLDLD
jgi:hypothetical protein